MRRPTLLSLALLAVVMVSNVAFAQKRGDRTLITRQDLDEAKGSITHALDAVQRLRPNWLAPRFGRQHSGSPGAEQTTAIGPATEAIIYIDEKRQPGSDALRTVTAASIVEIRYMDQNKAVQMLGPGHEAGAILVKTEQAPK